MCCCCWWEGEQTSGSALYCFSVLMAPGAPLLSFPEGELDRMSRLPSRLLMSVYCTIAPAHSDRWDTRTMGLRRMKHIILRTSGAPCEQCDLAGYLMPAAQL